MSIAFNYKRAWKEYVMPELFKLPKNVLDVVRATRSESNNINQTRGAHVIGYSDKLMDMFNEIPTSVLAWAAEVVDYYGHFSPIKACYSKGFNWKFKYMASMSMIKRTPYEGEIIHMAKARMDSALNNFYDHEKGTPYNNDEIVDHLITLEPGLGKNLVQMYKVQDVNHKPDVFCIGSAHMAKSTGMYLDPNVADCAHCRQPYSAHTHDTVMFLKPMVNAGDDPDAFLKDNIKAIQEVMERIVELCKTASFNLSGFAFVRP